MSFTPKRGALGKIQNLPGVQNAIFNQASAISSRAGEGVEPRKSTQRGRARPRAVALTTTQKAINRNRKHNTLARSIR